MSVKLTNVVLFPLGPQRSISYPADAFGPCLCSKEAMSKLEPSLKAEPDLPQGAHRLCQQCPSRDRQGHSPGMIPMTHPWRRHSRLFYPGWLQLGLPLGFLGGKTSSCTRRFQSMPIFASIHCLWQSLCCHYLQAPVSKKRQHQLCLLEKMRD